MVQQDDWDKWLPIAYFVHNQWPNATTKLSPHKVLLGYRPAATEAITPETNNAAAEDRETILKEHRAAAVQALNKTAQLAPPAQYSINQQVWLEAKHLALPYQTTKLAPKCQGPFRITQQISPVAYKLELPPAWMIHPVFHASLLMPYHETTEHGANYQHPEMVNDQEEYEVEQVINHWYYGHKKALQYLIHWKGYSAADDTWEPADQVFTDALVKAYHRKHPLEGKEAPTFATHLCVALAKSHWHPHSPLMNFGVTGPITKQDCTGALKISAPTVPIASGTTKNMSTLTHCAVTQPIKTTAKADVSEKSALKRSIHKALVKFFSCLPHTPPHSPIAPTAGQRTVAQCSMPLNALRPPATMIPTLTCGQSAFMAGNASSSPKIFPTSTPVNAALLRPSLVLNVGTGRFPQPWKALKTMPTRWSRPLWPSSVTV